MPPPQDVQVSSSSTKVDKESGVAVRMPSNVLGAMEDGEKKEAVEDPGASENLSTVPEFKEGGYGWVVVLCVGLINAHTWGLNSSYAVFLAYYLRSGLIGGASPTAFAFVGGLSISIALLFSPLATLCIARYGTRTTLLLGVVFETIAFIGASFTTEIWHLLLSQGVAFGIGMGFLFTGSVGVVPQWFDKHRSFANSIATSGSGFGGLTYSLATNAMIKSLGLPWAFRILAIIAFVVNGICSLLIRDRNKSVGAVHVAIHKDVFKKAEFYLFVSWAFFSLLGYTIVVFSLPDYGQTVGLTATQGSLIGALFNLSQGLGRPVIGYVSDSMGRINVASLGTLVASIGALFIWTFAGKAYAGVIIYSLLGAFAGVLWATVAPVGVEVIGIQLLPSALSVLWLILVLPATFAEVIGLGLRKPGVDGYLDVQMFTGFVYLAAFLSAWILRGWKLYQLQTLEQEKQQPESEGSNQDMIQVDGPAVQRRTFSSFLLSGKWIFAVQRV